MPVIMFIHSTLFYYLLIPLLDFLSSTVQVNRGHFLSIKKCPLYRNVPYKYVSTYFNNDSPVISAGFSRPSNSSIVGARSARRPSFNCLSPKPMPIRGTMFVV